MVIIPGAAGMFGVLPGHVPTISELKPGLLEVTVAANDVQKFFISSGFAFAHPVRASPLFPPPSADSIRVSWRLARPLDLDSCRPSRLFQSVPRGMDGTHRSFWDAQGRHVSGLLTGRMGWVNGGGAEGGSGRGGGAGPSRWLYILARLGHTAAIFTV